MRSGSFNGRLHVVEPNTFFSLYQDTLYGEGSDLLLQTVQKHEFAHCCLPIFCGLNDQIKIRQREYHL